MYAVHIHFTPLKNLKELVMHTKLEISQYSIPNFPMFCPNSSHEKVLPTFNIYTLLKTKPSIFHTGAKRACQAICPLQQINSEFKKMNSYIP